MTKKSSFQTQIVLSPRATLKHTLFELFSCNFRGGSSLLQPPPGLAANLGENYVGKFHLGEIVGKSEILVEAPLKTSNFLVNPTLNFISQK
jgi:hypothetical protein